MESSWSIEVRARTRVADADAFKQRHRAICYRDARASIARYLIAHDVEYTRAYGAATDMLGEDLIDTIERG